jgi:hypothetical protein
MTTQQQAYEYALKNGWEVDQVSLYDEEGVEGWCWTSPDGNEYYEVGDWYSTPEVPEEVFSLLAKK